MTKKSLEFKPKIMDKKWLNFGGMLHNCIYDREHATCPYNQFRKMDQVEKLEKLLSATNSEAKRLENQCNSLRCQCQAKIAFSLENLYLLNHKSEKVSLSV